MRIWKWIAAAVAMAGTTLAAQAPVAPPSAPPPALADRTAGRPVGASAIAATANRAAVGVPLTATDVDAWLDGFMPSALATGDIAGAVVVVVKDGAVLTERGYGYADIASGRRVDPRTTLFRPGSVSKLVVWTAVMQLVEQGRIDLDRDVNAYLDFKIPPRDGKPVTMRQIMTHTAGFEEAMKDIIFTDPAHNFALEPYLKRWTPQRIFAPGTTPAYSNWATALAGYIVERRSGMAFDDYVEQRIFAPLDMRTASFRQPLPPALRPLMATGYERASLPARKFEFVGPAPAGSMSASGLDMAKFMLSHLAQGRGILRPETAAMMHDSPLAKVDAQSLFPPLNRMELGFFETNINGREVIAHLGDTNDFHTSLHLFMKEGVGLYVSFNSAGKEGAAHAKRTALFEGFADRYFPATGRDGRDGRVDRATAARHAQMLAGHWEVTRRASSNWADILNLVGQVEVGVNEDGGLVIPSLTRQDGSPRVWDEVAPFVWRDRGGHDRIAVQVADGRIVRWSYSLVAPFMAFERVPAWRSAGWLMPALYAALAVLLLTVILWPTAWLVRRANGLAHGLSGPSLKASRATRIMALAVLVVLAGWAGVLAALTSGVEALGDGVFWLLQIGGAIVFVGALGIALWNMWLTWRDGRGWVRKLWSVLIVLAAATVLFAASTYGLLSMTVNY